jgi:hypothetical protein
MRLRCLALAVLCALSVPSVFAAEDPEVAAKVKWVMPWKADTSLTYETESLETETTGDAEAIERSTDTSTVRIIEASSEGFVQAWSSKDLQYTVLKGDKSFEAAYRAMAKELEDLVVEAKLDKAGNYAGLRNFDALLPRMRVAMQPMLLSMSEAELAKITDAGEREKARARMKESLDGTLERMLAPAVAEALLSRHIQVYNAFVGIELEPDQAYEVALEIPNPVGGPAFPATMTFSLSVSEDDPEDLFVTFDQVIDPEKGTAGALAIGENLAGQKLEGMDKMGTIDIKDEGLFVVNRTTGVIEMFETTRTTTFAGTTKVERERMRLLDGTHDHVWRDAQDAVDAEAEAEAEAAKGDHQG